MLGILVCVPIQTLAVCVMTICQLLCDHGGRGGEANVWGWGGVSVCVSVLERDRQVYRATRVFLCVCMSLCVACAIVLYHHIVRTYRNIHTRTHPHM